MVFLLLAVLNAEPTSSPETRALAYLAKEVPRWSAANKCYSCHNNGDAARALYTAKRLSIALPEKTLDDTTRWLEQPKKWDRNGGEGPYNDKILARIQFAAALAEAMNAGLEKDRQLLIQAAELVAEHQRKDGSWKIGAEESLGSPATHGAFLATHFARRTLQKADPKRFREAITTADRWLRQAPVKNVLDAAAVVLALETADDDEATTQREKCLGLIRKGESNDGGWGPYVTSSPETFDTAVVVLALLRTPHRKGVQDMVRRGRAFLVSRQEDDGSWKETTRPAGGDSYAQRLSTTGWATLALLATRSVRAAK